MCFYFWFGCVAFGWRRGLLDGLRASRLSHRVHECGGRVYRWMNRTGDTVPFMVTSYRGPVSSLDIDNFLPVAEWLYLGGKVLWEGCVQQKSVTGYGV